MAFELSEQKWKLVLSDGARAPSRYTVAAGDRAAVVQSIAKARGRCGLAREAKVHSCYEAGRDGFWLHRWLGEEGIDNIVVDSSSIEVNRRARRAKTDRLDGDKLLAMLLRYHAGERRVWSVARVPTVHSLSHTFTLSSIGEGAEAFFATITEPPIAALIERDDIVYLVAETVPDGKLGGAAAMRDNRVLSHLFVDPAYQGAGPGRRLWECLRDDALRAGNLGAFIVNSSLNAVPVYEKFGFVVASARVEKHGGAYVPMVLELTTRPSDKWMRVARVRVAPA